MSPAPPRMYPFFLLCVHFPFVISLVFFSRWNVREGVDDLTLWASPGVIDCRGQEMGKRSGRKAAARCQNIMHHTHIQNQRLNYIRNSSFPPRIFLPLTFVFIGFSLTNGD